MADIIRGIFKNKRVNFNKLTDFGFLREGAEYKYSRALTESGFIMSVAVSADGSLAAAVTDPSCGEPYVLHLAGGAAGKFVGEVRTQYEQILTEIADCCFETEIFKAAQAKELIKFVSRTYGDELEFLWKKFPENAVWRRADTQKWYGALLTVSRRKLGILSDETVEIIDLRAKADEIEGLVDNKKFFPGWHMNKKSWFTVVLDGSVPTEEIERKLEESYRLAVK